MAEPSDLNADIEEAIQQAGVDLALARPGADGARSLEMKRREREQVRRTRALALRMAGLTYAQIGEQLGISADGAEDMIVRTLGRAQTRMVDEQRELENARLDRAQAAIWEQVLAGDLKAIDTYLKISARRAKMNGLDEPTRIQLSVTVRQEMEDALARLEQVVLHQVIPGEVVNADG